MTLLFKANQHEQAARLLCKRLRHVVAKAEYQSEAGVRLRPSLLTDLEPNVFLGRWGALYESQIEAWKQRGGLLIDHINLRRVPCDGMLLCEAPIAWWKVEDQANFAKEALVVYRPKTWKQHEKLFEDIYPDPESCRKYVDMLHSATNLSPMMSAVRGIIGLPNNCRIAGLLDSDIESQMGMTRRQLSYIRRSMIVSREKLWVEASLISCRYPPDEPGMLPLFNYLNEKAPAVSGSIKVAQQEDMRKASASFRKQLRAMIRQGCIERKGRVQFFLVGGIKPNYDQMDSDRDIARRRFDHCKAMIDKLPELE